MEENNKFETSTDSSGSGSMLYGPEPQQQREESGHSSVYGTELQQPSTAPVPLTKPTEPEQPVPEPVQLAKPTEPEPVQLAKPIEPEQPPEQPIPMPVQLTKPTEPEQPPEQPVPEPVQLTKPTEPEQPIPMQAGQPNQNSMGFGPMGFGPMQVPPPVQGAPAAKPKKNKAGLVVGILCAAAVVIVIAIGILVTKSLFGGGGPQKQLAKGIANMAKEMAAYQSSVAEDIGLDAINQLKDTKPVNTRVDFSFTDPSATSGITSIDIKVDGVTDYKKKMAEYGLSVGAYGFSMNVGSIVAADNILYLSVPMVLQNDVYSLDLTNLGENFNNSAWSSLMDETLPEDYSLTLFGDQKTDGVESAVESELRDILDRQGRTTADSVKFETIKQKKAFTFNDTSAEYGGVRVTMDKDAYNGSMETLRDDILTSDFYKDFMNGYQSTYAGDFDEFKEDMDYVIEQLFGLRFEQDIVLDFYLDQKGRIVNISTPEDIALSGQDMDVDSLAVDISFSGTERTLDSIEGGVYVQSGDAILYMGISRTADITDEYYSENLTLTMQESNSDDEITFWYANKWGYGDQTFDMKMSIEVPGTSMGISADGGYTDIVKGESYTFQINHGALTIDGEDLLLLTGSIGIEPTENAIEVPENAIDVLEMSESDIEDLFYDMLY